MPAMWPRLGCVVVLFLAGTATTATAQDSVQTQVKQITGALEKATSEDVWRLSAALIDLGDTAIPALRESLDSPSPQVQLAVCRALAQLGDANAAAATLIKLAQGATDVSVRRSAIELMGPSFSGHAGVEKFLNKRLDDSLDPLEKVDLAKALYWVSADNKLKAKRALQEVL